MIIGPETELILKALYMLLVEGGHYHKKKIEIMEEIKDVLEENK